MIRQAERLRECAEPSLRQRCEVNGRFESDTMAKPDAARKMGGSFERTDVGNVTPFSMLRPNVTAILRQLSRNGLPGAGNEKPDSFGLKLNSTRHHHSASRRFQSAKGSVRAR